MASKRRDEAKIARERREERRVDKRDEAKSQLEIAKVRQRTTLYVVDRVYKLFRVLIGAGAFVAIAYYVRSSIADISGKTTDFRAVANATGGLSVNEWVAYALTGVCGVGWYNSHRLRRRTIKDHASYIAELEKRRAPERTSSGLLEDGTPKKEDRDD